MQKYFILGTDSTADAVQKRSNKDFKHRSSLTAIAFDPRACLSHAMIRPARSNSSDTIRLHLKTHYGAVPEISSKIALLSYLKFCKTLYESAIQAYRQRDMRRAYVDLYRFQILALHKVPAHKDFKVKSPATASAKAWLEKTKVPALDLLEEIVYQLDLEEDQRLDNARELDLIDEFDDMQPVASTSVHNPKDPVSTANPAGKSMDLSVLSIPDSSGAVSVRAGSSSLQYSVPDIEYPEANSDGREEHGAAAADGATISKTDAVILQYLGNYRSFSIPQPSTTTIDVKVGARHFFFLQDDFYTSFSGFLPMLPPELQLSQSATEMNRCFFIHLGIALSIHPFALQCAFRSLAARAMETAEDWEKDILSSVRQYCGFVDANMLCFLWPAELNAFRVCFISGPLTKPLISCFQPPTGVAEGDAEGLTEIVVRCSGDHFTLLRPLHQDQNSNRSQHQDQQQQREGYRVISKLLAEGRAAQLVVQVSDARDSPPGQPQASIAGALSQLLRG